MNKKSAATFERIIIIFICTSAIMFGLFVHFLPILYYNQGKDAYDNKKYIAAYNALSKAISINKKDKNIRYYYTKTLSNLKPTLKIQQELFAISDSNIQDSARQAAKFKVAELKERFLKPYGETYIDQVPSEIGVVRWDSGAFPLKIAIVKNTGQLPEYFEVQILKALNQWRTATQFMTYNIVNDVNQANIVISIEKMPVDACNNAGCHYAVGITSPSIENGLLKKMTITIYDKDPRGIYFSDKELYNTVLHEMGHALGIMGHSFNADHLMHMSNESSKNILSQYRSEFQYLASADINTIKLLYNTMPEVTNIPLSSVDTKNLIYAPIIVGNTKSRSDKKLQEADNYIKKAPDVVNGYIDKAIALAELNKTPEAIETLNKALKIAKRAEDKFVINYNAAVIYLNNGMPSQAKEYALAAQAISNTEEIQELLENINTAIKQSVDIIKN